MAKLKITEEQAKTLGIKKLTEDGDDNGVKSIKTAMGDAVIRIVVSGDMVIKLKERILQLIARQDPENTTVFYPQTNKIVGNVKEIRFASIKRDIESLDSSISIEKKIQNKTLKPLKESIKNIVKITKEQYNRIFSNELITESDKMVSGLNKVDDTLKHETKELIKYLYRKSDTLSPYWLDNGLSYRQICDRLLEKNIIIDKDNKYELSKTLGNPKEAILTLELELESMLPHTISKEENIKEIDNYPMGANNSSDAPWKDNEPKQREPIIPKHIKYNVVGMNKEIAILKDKTGELFVFFYGDIKDIDLANYSRSSEDSNDLDIDDETITNYINDNLDKYPIGHGLEAWENGDNFVKIDDVLRKELIGMFDKSKQIVNVLKSIDETINTPKDASDKLKTNVSIAATPKETNTEDPIKKQSRIIAKLAELKDKERKRQAKEKADLATRHAKADDYDENSIDEMTGAGSSGAFTSAMGEPIKKEMPIDNNELDTPVVKETTSGSSGAYDVNALPNVGRNGNFKKHVKSKAEKVPQWSGGAFIKQPECSKLDNNKEAQNGGCNQGASSLHLVKPKGSINTPSLGETKTNKK